MVCPSNTAVTIDIGLDVENTAINPMEIYAAPQLTDESIKILQGLSKNVEAKAEEIVIAPFTISTDKAIKGHTYKVIGIAKCTTGACTSKQWPNGVIRTITERQIIVSFS